jgi:hypothetical protein
LKAERSVDLDELVVGNSKTRHWYQFDQLLQDVVGGFCKSKTKIEN